MAAPVLTFTISRTKISAVSGYDHVDVSFSSDIAYVAFECRATRAEDPFGVGVGRLIASFSTTPAEVTRAFEVYDYDLVNGEGDYRISLYAQSESGEWNDYWRFIPASSTGLQSVDPHTSILEDGVLTGLDLDLSRGVLDLSGVSYVEVDNNCLTDAVGYQIFYCMKGL